MSSWSAKLARLEAEVGAPSPRVGSRPSLWAEGDKGLADRPSGDAARLEEIRARLSRMLGAPPTPSSRAAERGTRSEPPAPDGFVVKTTERGPLHLRRTTYSQQRGVGRIPIASALSASPEMLGLLALDPRLASVDFSRALYVDTETTGLALGAGTVAFVIGLGYFEAEGHFVLEQLLVRELGGEAPALARLAALWARAEAIVTFNGKSFDVPLLQSRWVLNRVAPPPERPHLDLVHVARRVHGARLGKRTLANVERNVLGFAREGDIASAEIPARYFHFLRTGDFTEIGEVAVHNAHDIAALAALVGLYGEPLSALGPEDLVGVARTLGRSHSFALADRVLSGAFDLGAGDDAVRVRAELARARGDKARALADFEVLARTIDDPAVRLALAKLYEHHAKEPLLALDAALRGTGETPERAARRRARLEAKIARLSR